jgi:hypothetical protein
LPLDCGLICGYFLNCFSYLLKLAHLIFILHIILYVDKFIIIYYMNYINIQIQNIYQNI